jgi:DNA gyrase inhibitor GyrI
MPENFIKIVLLPSMKVASFHSLGEHLGEPEKKAYSALIAWAKPKGFLDRPAEHQVFGFNNPDPPTTEEGLPDPNKPYGYEFWMSVGKNDEIEDEIDEKTVEGGLYAVITCKVGGPVDIGKTWGRLVEWIKNSEEYTFHPKWKGFKSHYDKKTFEYGVTGLEHHLNPMETPPKGKPWQTEEQLIIDIYAPVIRK